MIAYIDSSVLLRVALVQVNALPEWRWIERGVSSRLIAIESLRTLDRLRLRARLADEEIARRRATILELIETLELVEIDTGVLDRAAQPMPTELGTLDAIHLASALLWREAMGVDPLLATHDVALAVAAQAHGFTVVGSDPLHGAVRDGTRRLAALGGTTGKARASRRRRPRAEI
jgi:predicted nucleic acid-binding protein